MIQLATKTLDSAEQDVLNALQKRVDDGTDFSKRVEIVQKLWNGKGGKKGEQAFDKIGEKLKKMCVYVGICNYCEQSEANDIEHIHPKSFFPEHAFVWDNYILACKQCNTGHKLDKGYVFDNHDNLHFLARTQEPPSKRIAFINIRTENPSSLMMLNPKSYKFETLPDISDIDEKKVKATLEILELNERDTLLAARKSASRHYYDMLSRLINLQNAGTKGEFEQLLYPDDNRFDLSKSLPALKAEIKESIKNYIVTYQHPSVWLMIKLIESKTNVKWQKLFEKIPEALTW